MPLTVTTRAGRLIITGTVTPAGAANGVRIRRRAGSDDVRLAKEEAAALEARILRDHYHGIKAAPERRWAEAVVSYLDHEARSAGTARLLEALTRHWGATSLNQITEDAVAIARDVVLRPGAKPGTVRRNLYVPVAAVLNHAAGRGWCQSPRLRPPAEPKGRTQFLRPAQVQALIDAASPALRPLVIFLACTGCRLSEALGLQWDAVDLQGATARLHEGETKGGQGRVIHLTPAAIVALAALPGRVGAVFRAPRRRRIAGGGAERPAYRTEGGFGGQIRRAWTATCATAKVEATPHVLRHTWASWHYALHKDLLKLKIDGGWATASQVERYAHLMAAGQETAIKSVWGNLVAMANSDTRAIA